VIALSAITIFRFSLEGETGAAKTMRDGFLKLAQSSKS
jgi:hypothetical protein